MLNVCKKLGTSFTILERGTLMRSTITCMKGLKYAQITKKKKKCYCYQCLKPKKPSGSNNKNLGKVYGALDNY